MAASPETVQQPQERVLVITRVFDAPRALVFKTLTQPEHLARWWGPEGFTLPSCEVDLRPGGVFRCTMRSPKGSEHRLHCVYREIVEPERLVYTWTWLDEDDEPGHETLVTITLEEGGTQMGEKTLFTMHQAVFESESARDAHNEGWSGGLDRLEGYLATL
ncbi:MAG: SRPBCC domain-containing protein [Kiloniellaceae bacterium]